MNFKIIPGGGITSAAGFMAGAAQAAIKKPGRFDVALVSSKVPAAAAAVFTTNKYQAAPVLISKKHLEKRRIQGFVVNSGCANACTGDGGLRDALMMAEASAAVLGCGANEVLVASTGVIGVPLPMDKVKKGIKEAGENLHADNGPLAAQAIMTTDTFAKELAVQFEITGKTITVGGMAKGSGMIHPNMATMLGFVTTDAAISAECLQKALSFANEDSFNMVTVDGDTSTNDCLLVLANGLAGNAPITDKNSDSYILFEQALTYICTELAILVAKDGEGATKLMEVKVYNAPSKTEAALGARAIAGSNLVKAALFGEDANWGRIICALGYSGAEFDPGVVDVYLGDVKVAEAGCSLGFDEEAAAKVLSGKKVTINVDLKTGKAEATAWGCDLTYDYVKINGSYRT